MAFRPVTGGNSRKFDRKRRPSVQRHQPAHRSSEPHTGVIPLHRFWKREFRDQLREEFFQDHVGGPPLLLLHRKEILPFRSLANLQVLDGDSLPCGKSRRRSGRLAGLIECHRFGRPHRFLDYRGLLGREPLNHQSQSSWGSHRASGLKRETLVFQQLLSRIFEGSQGGSDELVGKFFDADLKQQLGSGPEEGRVLFFAEGAGDEVSESLSWIFLRFYERRATALERGPDTFAPPCPVPRLSSGCPIAARSSM